MIGYIILLIHATEFPRLLSGDESNDVAVGRVIKGASGSCRKGSTKEVLYLKIIFFGTPEIAEVYLKELTNSHEVLAVITRPDRPKDRGQNMMPPPVKTLALEHGIPVFQPEKFTPEITEKLISLKPEVGVVVSYGKIIPENIFKIPKLGCFNIHFSLLPKYRGAAPMQWALINGEKETGTTTFWIEKSLDSGPIIVQKKIEIRNDDDLVSLTKKLTSLGIVTMQETFDKLSNGQVKGEPQIGDFTLAHSLKKEDGKIDWSKNAVDIFNLIRGTNPWPGAFSTLKESKKTIKILKAHVVENTEDSGIYVPGQITEIVKNCGFVVSCGQGKLMIDEVHPENKKPMSAWSFLQGCHYKVQDKIF